MALQPYKGAMTAQFYVLETTPGVTPDNPVWQPLRNSGGIPAVTRDALVSNELDGSRETSSIRTGNRQVTGEYAIELSAASQDELLAGAMTSSWAAGST
ncbi:phage tail tube protein, partial [Acinetobacter baumannii]